MSIRAFLAEPRPMHRTMAIALGALMVCAAIFFGVQSNFTNWPGVTTLGALGLVLTLSGCFLAESKLQWLFTAALLLNIAGAIFAMFSDIFAMFSP